MCRCVMGIHIIVMKNVNHVQKKRKDAKAVKWRMINFIALNVKHIIFC